MPEARKTSLPEKIASRHFRKKNGLCLAEGLRCCQEAVARRPEALSALYCSPTFRSSRHWDSFKAVADKANARIIELAEREFAELSETETPQGIIAVMKMPVISAPSKAGRPFTLILDQVADPGNMGTILRTAWAVGLDACWLVKGSADPYSPKAVRAGMGAQFALDVFMLDTLEEAAQTARNFGVEQVWCTMPGVGISIFDKAFVCKNAALVIGNEANGISNPAVGTPVTIPMPGHAESLNAAQAATVFLIESLRN